MPTIWCLPPCTGNNSTATNMFNKNNIGTYSDFQNLYTLICVYVSDNHTTNIGIVHPYEKAVVAWSSKHKFLKVVHGYFAENDCCPYFQVLWNFPHIVRVHNSWNRSRWCVCFLWHLEGDGSSFLQVIITPCVRLFPQSSSCHVVHFDHDCHSLLRQCHISISRRLLLRSLLRNSCSGQLLQCYHLLALRGHCLSSLFR